MVDLHHIDYSTFSVPIAKANKSNLFYEGLQFNPPAHGVWNIVHQGFLIPGSHQIFICGEGCMRGVVLTAYEAGREKDFSSIILNESNVIEGTMEEQIIEGASDILSRMKVKPKAVEMFSTCIHYFTGCDLAYCYGVLRKRFPSVLFTDCYMTPITRNSGITPDEKMRMQLYSLLEKPERRDKGLTLLGNNYPMAPSGDFPKLIQKSGKPFRDITETKTWEAYQELAKSEMFVYSQPSAQKGAEKTVETLNGTLHYYPVSYDLKVIEEANNAWAKRLNVPPLDAEQDKNLIETRLKSLSEKLKGWQVSIDYTATSAHFSLAKLLLTHHIHVKDIYCLAVGSEDSESFDYLKQHYPDLILACPSHPTARFLHQKQNHLLAIGQKAAYFEGTDRFVNMIENNGLTGFAGILSLLDLMEEAMENAKPVEEIISQKGWGCPHE